MSILKEPLKGFRILDLSQGIAGPGAAMLCAQWGADVIKIEPLTGDWIRNLGAKNGNVSASTVPYNAGKRSVAVDLKSAAGVAAVMRMATSADAVLESFRPGVIDRLGLGYSKVVAANPSVVYASVSGFGQTGPYAGLPCSDTVAQAFSGLMSVNVGMDGIPHKIDTTIVDAITSLYTFQAMSMHLIHKQQTGEGARLDLSLSAASAAIQAPKLVEWGMTEGKPGALNAPAGSYQTSDGWIAVTLVKEGQFGELVDVVGLPELKDDARYASFQTRAEHIVPLRKSLDTVFLQKNSEYWLDRLKAGGVLCSRINNYGQWLNDEQVEHQQFAPVTNVADGIDVPLPRVPGAPEHADLRIPDIGEHTREVLGQFGYSADEVQELIDSGAVAESR